MSPGILSNGLSGLGKDLSKELGESSEANDDNGDTYPNPLDVEDFDDFGGALVEQGVEIELARLESPNGIERRWGYGRADLPDNQGYAYGILQTPDGEQVHGTLSFEWENATGRETQVQTEAKSKDMDTTDRYNRDAQIPMPEQSNKNRAEAFQALIVKFTPHTPAADVTTYEIDPAETEVRWPTTEYDVA